MRRIETLKLGGLFFSPPILSPGNGHKNCMGLKNLDSILPECECNEPWNKISAGDLSQSDHIYVDLFWHQIWASQPLSTTSVACNMH